MKNLSKLSIFLMMSSSAMAGGSALTMSTSVADGVYGGLGIGAVSSTLDTNISSVINIIEVYGKTNALGQAYLGYQKSFNPNYGAQLEAFYTYANTKKTLTGGQSQQTATMKSNGVYGFKVMPFYQVSKAAKLFGSVGVAFSNYKYQTPTAAQSLGSPSSYSKTLSGLLLGVGSEVAMSDQLSVRGEYQYTRYANWNITTPLTGLPAAVATFKPAESVFVASLVYKMA